MARSSCTLLPATLNPRVEPQWSPSAAGVGFRLAYPLVFR